jgi:hypothetical protein
MKLSLVATAILALSSTIGMAQTSATIRSGELTAGETRNLESREASINREEYFMRRADDGHLTAGDRAALTCRQDRVSGAIYRDKHNAWVR